MLLLTFIQLCFFSVLLPERKGRIAFAPSLRPVVRTLAARGAVLAKALRGAPPGPQAWMPSKS